MEKELFGGRPWHLPETTKDVFLLSGVQAWPSVHHALGSGSYFNLRSAQAKGYGLTNRVVPTVWLAHLTTEEFWSTQMARYGPAALSFPKMFVSKLSRWERWLAIREVRLEYVAPELHPMLRRMARELDGRKRIWRRLRPW